MKVLMLGNDPSVKGGITSVISQILAHDWKNEGVEMKFIQTYIETNNIKKIVFFANAYRKIESELKHNRPDIVHIHMSYKGSFTRKYLIHKLCQKYGVPDLIHLHGSEFKKWFDASDTKRQEKIRSLIRECRCFIILGDKWKKTIKEIEPSAKTLVLSNAVHIPVETVEWNEPFKILYMGVLIRRKGVADLLQAVNLLKDEASLKNVVFMIAGTGYEEGNLKALSKELGIEKYVEFLGWIDGEKKEKLLKNCQMLVLPSYNEGLPIAILEAISYGMPVVATDVGDISAAVHNGENGYLFTPGDTRTLANKVYDIFLHKDIYEGMSRKSKMIAKSDFSDKGYFDQMIKCYKEGYSSNR